VGFCVYDICKSLVVVNGVDIGKFSGINTFPIIVGNHIGKEI
jgi:hypothetical protein